MKYLTLDYHMKKYENKRCNLQCAIWTGQFFSRFDLCMIDLLFDICCDDIYFDKDGIDCADH